MTNEITEKRGRGRPPSLTPDDETLKKVRELAAIQCTKAEAARVLSVNRDTLSDFFRKHRKAEEAWSLGREAGKCLLRRHQFKLAQRSPAMAIWLGKQYLGQKDKCEIGGDPTGVPTGIEHGVTDGLTALLRSAR